MQIRTPAVAGMFYPNEKAKLEESIKKCFLHPFGPGRLPPNNSTKKIFGVICPHAGYVYSGPIAAQSYFALSKENFDCFIIIGPNHWGIGSNIATMDNCKWQTPLGSVEVDSQMVEEITSKTDVIEVDFFSHTRDHCLEVQIPLLQKVFLNQFKIVPIIMNDQSLDAAKEVGESIAKIAKERNIMIIGSSDFTHYETNDFAHKQDKALIKPILDLDVEEFYRVLEEKNVSACGYGAIGSTMIACKELGATKGELIKYATSGDVSGDKSSVVGYGSIVFT